VVRALSVEDFEAVARRRLPRPLYVYIASAAETGASLADNRKALAKWGFVPRILAAFRVAQPKHPCWGIAMTPR
jgi:L-lactate dehydrogenase (cytochrome)